MPPFRADVRLDSVVLELTAKGALTDDGPLLMTHPPPLMIRLTLEERGGLLLFKDGVEKGERGGGGGGVVEGACRGGRGAGEVTSPLADIACSLDGLQAAEF